jgi:hypothetical protein
VRAPKQPEKEERRRLTRQEVDELLREDEANKASPINSAIGRLDVRLVTVHLQRTFLRFSDWIGVNVASFSAVLRRVVQGPG